MDAHSNMLIPRKDTSEWGWLFRIDGQITLRFIEQAVSYYCDPAVSWLVGKCARQVLVEVGPVRHNSDVNTLEATQGVLEKHHP